jgi:glycosyltransferase involved in cell wall biosynthesis
VTRRIAYVLKRFPRISETFIATELLELRRQGTELVVFAISKPPEPFIHGFLSELDVPVVYLPHRPIREPIRVARGIVGAIQRSPRGWLKAALWAALPPRLTSIRRLMQASVLRVELEEAGVRHVHAHFATAAARLAYLVRKMGGPTYSVTTHAKDIWHEDVEPRKLRERLSGARFVATVTERNREHLVGLLGAGTPVRVVPNSVDAARITPTDRRPERGRVLTVARLVEKKGISDLVEACDRLTHDGMTVKLIVVGDGPERPTLEAASSAARVDAEFLGPRPHEDVIEQFRRAAVFVLPCVHARSGDRDGLPTSVLEAMAAGVPVVTTSVNGLPEAVVHGSTGLVVPEHDADALAAAIRKLLDDPDLGATLAASARQRVEDRFSVSTSTAQLRTLLEATR